MSEHTPLPWSQYAHGTQIYGTTHSEKEGNFICSVQSHTPEKDAAYIVKAVNAHDALIEQLEKDKSRFGNIRERIKNLTNITTMEVVDYIKQCEAEIDAALSLAREV